MLAADLSIVNILISKINIIAASLLLVYLTMKKFELDIVLHNKQIHISNKKISADEYISFLKRTDLGSQYPKEDFETRIKTLVNNVPFSLIAYHEKQIVGVCFGLTDFAYWLFLSDLGVDREYTHLGIGRTLVEQAHKLAGGEDNIIMFTMANENAVDFYKKCGWKPSEFMKFSKIKWTEHTVS